MPILLKPNGSYCLVQDFRDLLVLLLSPLTQNSKSLYSSFPYFSFYQLFHHPGLKDATFTIPLHPDSRSFAYLDRSRQLVAPSFMDCPSQGFHDSSSLWPSLASDLTFNLAQASSSNMKHLPLWCPHYRLSVSHMTSTSQLLIGGYQVSPPFPLPEVTYLGVLLSPTKRHINTPPLMLLFLLYIPAAPESPHIKNQPTSLNGPVSTP